MSPLESIIRSAMTAPPLCVLPPPFSHPPAGKITLCLRTRWLSASFNFDPVKIRGHYGMTCLLERPDLLSFLVFAQLRARTMAAGGREERGDQSGGLAGVSCCTVFTSITMFRLRLSSARRDGRGQVAPESEKGREARRKETFSNVCSSRRVP